MNRRPGALFATVLSATAPLSAQSSHAGHALLLPKPSDVAMDRPKKSPSPIRGFGLFRCLETSRGADDRNRTRVFNFGEAPLSEAA